MYRYTLRMRCVLIGNYGVGNLGDELLKQYFVETYTDIEWVVLSANPLANEYARFPSGLRSFLRFNWLRTCRAVQRSDAVVFGGGTLFTDSESVFACVIWWWQALLCRVLFRKPVLFAFQGIGPFRSKFAEFLAFYSAKSANYLSVRDAASLDRAKQWKLNKKIVQSFDPVLSLIEEENPESMSKNVFMLIPRHNSGKEFTKRANELLREKEYEEVRVLLFQPDDAAEQKTADEVVRILSQESEIVPIRSLETAIQELRSASLVLSHRFHGSLLGFALGKKVQPVPQSAGDKHEQLRTAMKNTDACRDLVHTGKKTLRQALEEIQ